MTDALRDECYCTDEGPCESHLEVLCSREGASLHTADELCAIFIGDVEDLRHDVRPWGAAMADAVALAGDYWEAHPSGGWCEDPDMSQALSEAVGAAESVLASEVGAFVWWDDGYVVGRITGGPLLEEDGDR